MADWLAEIMADWLAVYSRTHNIILRLEHNTQKCEYRVVLSSRSLAVSVHLHFEVMNPMVRMYAYTYKCLRSVSAHPCFLACEFQVPMGAYSG